jgi:hypothetical protein
MLSLDAFQQQAKARLSTQAWTYLQDTAGRGLTAHFCMRLMLLRAIATGFWTSTVAAIFKARQTGLRWPRAG